MSEQRNYRQFTPQQKAEIVLAGLGGDRSVRDVCREYQIAGTLYYQWRERLLEGGKAALANPRDKTPEQTEIDQLRSAWRLPRPRVPGVHRVLVRAIQEAPGVAIGVGIPGPGKKGDRRLHQGLPSPALLGAGLPHPHRGRRHLAA